MAKTVRLARLVEKANRYFLNSKPDLRDGRKCLQAFIADVLHEAGEYHGFRYLIADELPPGVPCGVIHRDGGNIFPDDSRVSFYVRDDSVRRTHVTGA